MALLQGHPWEWHRLVHVCRRWRYIVFDSPRSLDLQLFCTYGTPVKDNLDCWPALPIVMRYLAFSSPSPPLVSAGDEDHIIAALQHPDRIRAIHINVTTPLLERLATLARQPFPTLEHLELSTQTETGLILPSESLGGPFPRLRVLHLTRIAFPTLKHILLSAENLVFLKLEALPSSGYISPEALVVSLTVMTRLETLHLHFLSPISRLSSGRNRPKRRAILSAMEHFAFHGFSEYLERLLSGINAPVLKYIDITFFNQVIIFHTPKLLEFVCRPEARLSYDEAKVHCSETDISITLTREKTPHYMGFRVRCMSLDWQLSCMAEICDSLALIISDVRDLHIDASSALPSGQDDLLPLRDLFHQFRSAKRLFLTKSVAPYVKYALELEMATGVLPFAKVFEVKEHGSSPPHPPSRHVPIPAPAVHLGPIPSAPVRHNPSPSYQNPQSAHPVSSMPLHRSSAPLHPPSSAPLDPFSSVLIHPWLVAPYLQYDIRYHHSQINLPLPSTVLTEPASQPPLPSLTLRVGGLSWLVSVYRDSRLSNGRAIVTVQDVLTAIYVSLRKHVKAEDYNATSKSAKAAISRAFWHRVGTDPVQRAKGLRRIDFLCGRFSAQGLVPAQSGDNVWEVEIL